MPTLSITRRRHCSFYTPASTYLQLISANQLQDPSPHCLCQQILLGLHVRLHGTHSWTKFLLTTLLVFDEPAWSHSLKISVFCASLSTSNMSIPGSLVSFYSQQIRLPSLLSGLQELLLTSWTFALCVCRETNKIHWPQSCLILHLGPSTIAYKCVFLHLTKLIHGRPKI